MGGHDEAERPCIECGEHGPVDAHERCVYCEFGAYWAASKPQRGLLDEAGRCVRCGAESGPGRLCDGCADEHVVHAWHRNAEDEVHEPDSELTPCVQCGNLLSSDDAECSCVTELAGWRSR